MKVAVITDTHYGVRNDNVIFYDYQKKFNEKFFQTIDEENITTIIHAGDLFDRRKYINFITMKRCYDDFLKPILDRGLDFHIIAGNHDVYFKNTNYVCSLNELLREYENFHIYYDKPETITLDGLDILMIPWISDENLERSYIAMKETKAQVAFAHMELNGFESYKNHVYEGVERFDVKILEKFDILASGHFHHQSRKDNIYYLGAAYEFRWNDWNDVRGYHVFDTENRDFTFYKNPYTMFEVISYNDEDKKDDVENRIKVGFSELKNKYVKLVIEKKRNAELFDMYIRSLYDSSPKEVQILEPEFQYVKNSDIELSEESATFNLIETYIDEVDFESIDSNEVKAAFRSIYEEAVTIIE